MAYKLPLLPTILQAKLFKVHRFATESKASSTFLLETEIRKEINNVFSFLCTEKRITV
jgi:hypothetical protein